MTDKPTQQNFEHLLAHKDTLHGATIIDVRLWWNETEAFASPLLTVETKDGKVIDLAIGGSENLESPGVIIVDETGRYSQ